MSITKGYGVPGMRSDQEEKLDKVISKMLSADGLYLLELVLLRLRHKLQKPSNDAVFERLRDWLFLPQITACAEPPFGL